MEYFLEQLINGITLGSIYGLIAIGYTMVYGIIGMINFAHGDVFMVGAFVSLIAILAIGITASASFAFMILALVLVVIAIAMIIASAYNWTIERVAYRPAARLFPAGPARSPPSACRSCCRNSSASPRTAGRSRCSPSSPAASS